MAVKIYVTKDKDIRYEVLKEYGIDKSDILLNSFGKPYTNKGTFFSISHSKDYFVIAVSDNNIGIDIEYKRDLNFKEISNRVLKTEIKDLDTFYKTWTKYEAYTKYLGKSIFSEGEKLDFKDVKVNMIDIIDDLYIALVTKDYEELEVLIW